MNFTSLDLELNQPDGRIIQLGVVIGNIITGDVLEKVSYIISYSEPLNPFIIKLTGITDEMIAVEGIDLHDAYLKLKELHLKYNCYMNPITWGGGDSVELKEQLSYYPEFIPNEWCFGRRWIDCKTLYIAMASANGMKLQGGLAKVMTKFGLSFQGTKHRADDDAFNTFRLYKKFLTLMPNSDRWKG